MLVPGICQQKRGDLTPSAVSFVLFPNPEAAVNPGNSGGPVLNEAFSNGSFLLLVIGLGHLKSTGFQGWKARCEILHSGNLTARWLENGGPFN